MQPGTHKQRIHADPLVVFFNVITTLLSSKPGRTITRKRIDIEVTLCISHVYSGLSRLLNENLYSSHNGFSISTGAEHLSACDAQRQSAD
ncbi:MAG: hypothetical protein MRK02_11915 [Candidatus Scalindua sp.]|nr:hypothetical protein [Candidatus Scalindua sp.]